MSADTHVRSKSIVKIAIMMSKDSTAKLQFHRKEISTRWFSSTFVVFHAQSISDSFVL